MLPFTEHSAPSPQSTVSQEFLLQTEKLLSEIHAASDLAYGVIAEAMAVSSDAVCHSPLPDVCIKVSDLITESLAGGGHKTRREVRMTWLGREYDESGELVPLLHERVHSLCISHSYVELDVAGYPADRLVIDATWQQFLSEDHKSPNLPKVLIGTHDQVITMLQGYGITDRELLLLWTTQRPPAG